HRQEQQALRGADAPGRAARHEDGRPRLEPVRLSADGRDPAPLEDVEHLVALLVAPLLLVALEAEEALPELRDVEERRDRLPRLRGLDAVPHRANLYLRLLFLCRRLRGRVASQVSLYGANLGRRRASYLVRTSQ